MTMIVRVASNATQNVVLVPRKAVEVPQKVARQEVAALEEVRHAVAHQEAAIHRENRIGAAVAPAVMTTTIITHHAAVVEAAEDNG